jgi:pectin methylesterase-like acyl-CoA thioesterase
MLNKQFSMKIQLPFKLTAGHGLSIIDYGHSNIFSKMKAFITSAVKSFILLFMASCFSLHATAQYSTIVAKDGSGNHTTLKAAINAAPTNATALNPYVIYVKNGFYYEKDTVPASKPFVQVIGESIAETIIAFDAAAGNVPSSGIGTYGTSGSATLTVNANDFTAMNITFTNSFNYDSASTAGFAGTQAVAVMINADRVAFKNCRFLGNQDTLYARGGVNARQYFKDCYIDGAVDFIFGSSIAVFDSCVIYPKTRPSTNNSYLTAANTTPGQAYGYVFRDCKIPSNTGTTMYTLGRPWGNATSGVTVHNRVAFLNTSMGSSINPVGWSVWDAGTITDSISDAEYKSKNIDGTLKDISNRISWSHQLTDAEALNYTLPDILMGWDPCSTRSDFCPYQDPGIVVSNFKGTKGASVSTFAWNISWAITGIKYDLYRATTSGGAFSQIGTVTAVNDTAINFSLTDPLPPGGNIYYYYVVASKAGSIPDTTNTVLISTAPTISVLGTIGSFIQSLNPPAPSVEQSYTVSGVNLVDNITITAPANFEISTDGITWYTNLNPLVLTPSGSSIAATIIKVRLNASVAGTSSGNIVHSTTGLGAINANVAVSGNTTNDILLTYVVLQQWPLTANNTDSADVRVASVLPGTPLLNKLYLSNGTQVAAVPAYSGTHGQAFGASVNGDGSWGTGAGGPGGTLNRTFYEQFVIKAAPGKSVRVDSFILTVAQHNSANGRIAIVFSKSGFTADSTDILSFAANTALANQTGATTNLLRYALNGADGLTLASGDSIAVRLYFAVGSSSPGRYVKVKNVYFKGVEVNSTVPLTLLSFTGVYENKKVKLTWVTTNEINTRNFIIERSDNGNGFIAVGNMDAAGISSTNSYSFIDNRLLYGTVYYRLKMTDRDGNFQYSYINAVNIKWADGLKIIPNPVTDNMNVFHAKATPGATIEVYSFDERRVLQLTVPKDAVQTNINASIIPAGAYNLVFVNNRKVELVKFIKQ